ncbi:FmdB family zinc ribbon protein [Dietzia sp.]|uniref:FmdB family zinc ribbon protein n=1 Tax=Dietzia sp. TaxID=1871616 RepID=UPI002FD9472D
MPMYSYKCRDCGEAFDIRQEFSDPSLTECPNCGGTLRKLFNSVGITFKGSGFYRNDSRSEGRSTGSDGAGSTSSSTSEPSSSSSSSNSGSGSGSAGSSSASSTSSSTSGSSSSS